MKWISVKDAIPREYDSTYEDTSKRVVVINKAREIFYFVQFVPAWEVHKGARKWTAGCQRWFYEHDCNNEVQILDVEYWMYCEDFEKYLLSTIKSPKENP